MTGKHMSDISNLQKNRPLSPHLSIYKLQLTSGLSILHRITGAYLFLGIIALSWLVFALVYFPYILENLNVWVHSNFFTTVIFKLTLFIWVFALFYHLLNGIRHLFWDVGKGFSLEKTYFSGKLVITLSIILTLICWIISSSKNKEPLIIEETIIEVGN